MITKFKFENFYQNENLVIVFWWSDFGEVILVILMITDWIHVVCKTRLLVFFAGAFFFSCRATSTKPKKSEHLVFTRVLKRLIYYMDFAKLLASQINSLFKNVPRITSFFSSFCWQLIIHCFNPNVVFVDKTPRECIKFFSPASEPVSRGAMMRDGVAVSAGPGSGRPIPPPSRLGRPASVVSPRTQTVGAEGISWVFPSGTCVCMRGFTRILKILQWKLWPKRCNPDQAAVM